MEKMDQDFINKINDILGYHGLELVSDFCKKGKVLKTEDNWKQFQYLYVTCKDIETNEIYKIKIIEDLKYRQADLSWSACESGYLAFKGKI